MSDDWYQTLPQELPTPPVVMGGQGRTQDDIEAALVAVAYACLGASLTLFAWAVL